MDKILVPIHRAGRPFIAAFAAGALLLWWISGWLGLIGLILTAWCVYFFRDPDRVTPARSGLVISPADGVVQKIDEAPPPPELGLGDKPLARIAVFMNVFDVHVNRTPAAGVIEQIAYQPGKFLNASLDKASEDNERQSFLLRLADKRQIVFTQIAGLVARRIVTETYEGAAVQAGERVGMIRFGSRVDVYLPEGVHPLVCQGQRCIAGETVLADMESKEKSREGIIRR
ncbi:MAG: phosphatidylserine decarboxylase [Rhodospirillales bacterium]